MYELGLADIAVLYPASNPTHVGTTFDLIYLLIVAPFLEDVGSTYLFLACLWTNQLRIFNQICHIIKVVF